MKNIKYYRSPLKQNVFTYCSTSISKTAHVNFSNFINFRLYGEDLVFVRF